MKQFRNLGRRSEASSAADIGCPAPLGASRSLFGEQRPSVANRTIVTAVAAVALFVAALLAGCGEDDKGLTRQDVEEIVRSEVAAVRDQQATAPPKHVPEEYTKFLVREAIARYESTGRDATLAYYNSGESIDGQWYVFIGDPDGLLLANAANPDLVNGPVSDARGPNGFPVGDALSAIADEDGEWFSYPFSNPAADSTQIKHSWVVRHDGLVFGSGWYETGPRKSDAPAYTRSLVRQALDLYDALGLDETVAHFSSGGSVDGPWYVFVIGGDGRIIAHYDPEILGLDADSLEDPTGFLYGPELAAASREGDWVDYVIANPDTGQEQLKHSWVVRHDGLVFGSGWYEHQ